MRPNPRQTAYPNPSVAGFLLLNSTFKPIYSNTEVIHILAYPERPPNKKSIDGYLANKIREFLNPRSSPQSSPFLTELTSGRRRYFCWAFSLNPHVKNSFKPTMALLIVRSVEKPVYVSQLADEFHLTPRELETVGYLVQGLSSKEIAVRMNICPNTVKAFLRLVMIKMGVSTRSEIMAKLIRTQILPEHAQPSLPAHHLHDPATPLGG